MAHPDPKMPSAKIRWKSSRLDFFGIKTASSSSIIFHRAKLSTRVLLISAGANEGHVEGKTPREGRQGGLVLTRKCPGSLGTCNPEKTGLPGLPVS